MKLMFQYKRKFICVSGTFSTRRRTNTCLGELSEERQACHWYVGYAWGCQWHNAEVSISVS